MVNTCWRASSQARCTAEPTTSVILLPPDSGECGRNNWANLDRLKPTDEIKFVIASRRDWDWAERTIREHRLDERFAVLVSAVFGKVSPCALAEWLLASGLNARMQLQMHKYVWDPAARGV